MRASVVGSYKSLASQIGSRDKIYSARWKLMLISDKAKELFGRRELYVSFSTAGLHPGS